MPILTRIRIRNLQELRRPIHVVSHEDNEVMLGGILAGLLGSIAMLVILMVAALARGDGAAYPIKLIATTAFGPECVVKPLTTGVVVTGVMIHVLIGMGLGIVFGFLADAVKPRTVGGLVLGGVCYGLAIFLGMFLYVVPMLAPLLAEQAWLPSAIGHVAFGASLGLYWPITHRIHEGFLDKDVKPVPLPTI